MTPREEHGTAVGNRTGVWALVQSADYAEELRRLSAKHRSQVSRKVMDLTHNPHPGGSRTTLVGYERLCRVRAGDFRIIYAYDDKVVQVISLRRRSEDTYDHLDESEVRQFEEFRVGRPQKPAEQRVAEWEELAKGWAAPKQRPNEPLPMVIDESMLRDLQIPEEHMSALLAVTTADELLDCETVPMEQRERVLERVCPRATPVTGNDTPVVGVADLVDPRAAAACGPIVATDSVERRQTPRAGSDVPEPMTVVSAKELTPMKPYSGNVGKGIARDASYTVKLNGSVQLLYNVDDREHALLTTDDHPELVKMVNAAKRAGGNTSDGGRFVINEYRHVLVPAQKNAPLFAGVYTRDLEFAFEGSTITPVASATIKPGDVWPGPHVGVRYTLTAGAKDVRYELETARGTRKTVQLTDFHSSSALAGLLAMLRAVKPSGGAIYINEAREIFAPVDDGKGYQMRYIGHLGDKPWFPEPS